MKLRTLLATGALLAAAAPALAKEEVLVVTTETLEPALVDWIEHRESRGFFVTVKRPGDDVGKTIHDAYTQSKATLKYVLLLGDVAEVPCAYRPADAIKEFERDPRIATDGPYADVNGDDGIPDLAIGRIAASDVETAKKVLARTIAYETSPDFGNWRRKLHLVAGVGGFGAQQDFAIEQLTRLIMAREVPAAVDVRFMYSKPTSPYCPPADRFTSTFVDALNAGALVVAYVGHGSKRNLDRIRVGDAMVPILADTDVARVAPPLQSSPLAVFVACSTGSFDGKDDCLAELMLERERGPIAVIASSRVSSPYANAVLAKEMVAPLFDHAGARTTGDLLLAVKRRLVQEPAAGDPIRTQIENLAGSFFEPDPKRREVDRREHLLLYHLFGDPTAALARPRALEVRCDEEALLGETLDVVGTTPVDGTVEVELVRARTWAPPPGSGYAAATEWVVSASKGDAKDGTFSIPLEVPVAAGKGKYTVRVYVTGKDGSAMGAATTRAFAPRRKR